MLQRKYRLHAKDTIATTQVLSSPLFLLRIGKNQYEYNRIGVVVSKKVDTRAVIRNKVKRLILLCLERLQETKKGYDMLFILRKPITEKTQEEIYEIIKKLLTKEGYL